MGETILVATPVDSLPNRELLRCGLGERPMATNAFLLLDCFGLVFLMYALANFWNEWRRCKNRRPPRVPLDAQIVGDRMAHHSTSFSVTPKNVDSVIPFPARYRQINAAPEQRKAAADDRNASGFGNIERAAPANKHRSRAQRQERNNRNAGHNFYDFHDCIFWIVRTVREILQWDEVTKMFDSILSLAVCAALLVYLVYAMLRPEKF